MNIDPATLDTKAIAGLRRPRPSSRARSTSCCNIIPTTVVGAFAEGEILQVLFFAVLFGFALHALGERGTLVLDLIDKVVARAVRASSASS